jgi:hypothetical protein
VPGPLLSHDGTLMGQLQTDLGGQGAVSNGGLSDRTGMRRLTYLLQSGRSGRKAESDFLLHCYSDPMIVSWAAHAQSNGH